MARGDSIAPGSLVALVKDFLGQGLTATGALRELRSQGFGVNTQRWYRTYGETGAALANGPALAGAHGGSVLRDDQHTPWAAGKSGVYAYQVQVIVEDPTAGTLGRAQYTVLSATNMTPDEAIAQATDDFTSNATEGGSGEGQRVHGGVLTGAYMQTGYKR